jgi:acyl-CoA thioesterase
MTEAQRRRVETAMERVPFARLLGLELQSFEYGHAVVTMKVRDELKQYHGVVHGGAIASLIDSTTAFAIITLLKEDERTTTIDLTVSYLRPLTDGVAKASARVLRAGGRIIAVSAEVFDESGSIVATALSTYLRLAAR